MASIVWMAVFFLLMVEIFITGILVLPFPRAVRKFIARKIFTYDLGRRISFLTKFVVLALVLAVSDAIGTLRHLEGKDKEAENFQGPRADGTGGFFTSTIDKQRKFRAERNMYLSGFALTLMFVIARIVELMQHGVNVEEECDMLRKRLEDISEVQQDAGNLTSPASGTSNGNESTLRKRSTAASAAGSAHTKGD